MNLATAEITCPLCGQMVKWQYTPEIGSPGHLEFGVLFMILTGMLSRKKFPERQRHDLLEKFYNSHSCPRKPAEKLLLN